MTLNDLERREGRYFVSFQPKQYLLEPNYVKPADGTSVLNATKMYNSFWQYIFMMVFLYIPKIATFRFLKKRIQDERDIKY